MSFKRQVPTRVDSGENLTVVRIDLDFDFDLGIIVEIVIIVVGDIRLLDVIHDGVFGGIRLFLGGDR